MAPTAPETFDEKLRRLGITIAICIGAFLFIVFAFNKFLGIHIVTVEGNEVAVRQGLTTGIKPDVWMAGTHFDWMLTGVYKYNIGTQKITFDDHNTNHDAEYERIPVEVGENGGQKAFVAISVNYHLNPEHIIKLHNQGIGESYESVILKREIVDTVNEIARPYHSALDIYSGKGFVDFKKEIDKELKNNDVLEGRGIEVENTIVYNVHLDPPYEAEIAAKQLAIQQNLTKIEQTKVSEQEAKRIFALSQAKVEEARQEAEALKIRQVKAAEAQADQEVLAAEAEKKKRILEAEGQRDASLAKASGILAEGEAQAKVDALKRESLYAGESGAWRAKVEIAEKQASKLAGILKGVNVISDRALVSLGKEVGLTLNSSDSNQSSAQ